MRPNFLLHLLFIPDFFVNCNYNSRPGGVLGFFAQFNVCERVSFYIYIYIDMCVCFFFWGGGGVGRGGLVNKRGGGK